ncbi:MAG: hypothetical protein KIS79_06290 [Burkholderiales bacterium]|nr:hypothetical protein [Burkholderiales bacterium]
MTTTAPEVITRDSMRRTMALVILRCLRMTGGLPNGATVAMLDFALNYEQISAGVPPHVAEDALDISVGDMAAMADEMIAPFTAKEEEMRSFLREQGLGGDVRWGADVWGPAPMAGGVAHGRAGQEVERRHR